MMCKLEKLWLLVTAMLLGLASPLRAADSNTETASAPKPNLVFILADDLGWSDTTLYGNTKFYETPNIQRLSARGIVFTNAYAANPLCSPTRASIMTGLYPARIGITAPVCHLPQVRLEEVLETHGAAFHPALDAISATRLKTTYYTLAKAMHDAGYVTGHYGKWHLGPEPYSPLQQGFDVDVPHYSGPGPAGSYVAPWKFPPKLHFTGQPGEHIEDRMADEAIKFIRKNKDKPFFLNYWAFSVHAPFDAKQGLIAKYRAKADPKDPQHAPVYGAMVQSLDENVGRLIDTLDELKLTDNTIIVFFSDNGGNMYNRVDGMSPHDKIPPTSNLPLRGGKATIYEGGSREPCIVVWPGKIKPNTRTDALLSSVDWFPTIISMMGITPREAVKFDGVDQTPALLGTGSPRDKVFCYFPHYTPATGAVPCVYIRQGDWKLIRDFCGNKDQTDKLELYNLKADLGETKDVAKDHPQVATTLNGLIDGFMRDTEAKLPGKNPNYDPNAKAPAAGKGENAQAAVPIVEPEPAMDVRLQIERDSDDEVVSSR